MSTDLTPVNDRGTNALADRKAAEALGFSFGGDPWFAYGEELWDSGEQTFHAHRKALDEAPLATDMLRTVQDMAADQFRLDTVVDCRDLSFGLDGRLHGALGTPLGLLPLSYRQLLCGRAEAPAAASSYLPMLPRALATEAANWHLRSSGDAQTMLRTRMDGGGRIAYAAVGPNYPRIDVTTVAPALARNVHPTAKGFATVEGAKWSLTAQFGQSEVPVIGDVFHALVGVRGNDDGTGPAIVECILHQARCKNLTRLTATLDIDRIVHRGSAASLAEKVEAAIKVAYGKVAVFAERWAKAAETSIFDSAWDLGPTQTFATLVSQGHVTRPEGVTVEEWIERCVAAYWTAPEYGLTQRGINYALTKAAQSLSPWAAIEVEAEAGKLLEQFVYVTRADYANAVKEDGDRLGKYLEIN